MSDKKQKPEKPQCPKCKSNNIVRDAHAGCNEETQQWDQLIAVYDNFDCNDCGENMREPEWVAV